MFGSEDEDDDVAAQDEELRKDEGCASSLSESADNAEGRSEVSLSERVENAVSQGVVSEGAQEEQLLQTALGKDGEAGVEEVGGEDNAEREGGKSVGDTESDEGDAEGGEKTQKRSRKRDKSAKKHDTAKHEKGKSKGLEESNEGDDDGGKKRTKRSRKMDASGQKMDSAQPESGKQEKDEMDDEGDDDGVATKTSKKPKKVEKEKRCLAITKDQRAKELAKTNARIEKINEKHKTRVEDLKRELKGSKKELADNKRKFRNWRAKQLEDEVTESFRDASTMPKGEQKNGRLDELLELYMAKYSANSQESMTYRVEEKKPAR